ncbi:gamma-tubulin complex component 4 [Amyelois transitella]|uniref:gamma-tubulin complex component 4 n=1 Tax=Amyelois transitella TaxID=680683 RepID=UPI00299062B5|nr:gamma-tubulin complex component 4 [Amyelois transitella]XP_013187644.2 gamma-tubulin complex component 4 [Amyelois transitella]XP_060805781.1 gamma-tubulin complex component 4 [Amyelois transitella]XP_060805782.1 gamma-tubulin complex component 4 [Amyelois transitella]XP_060805783.1 gamma-tubulin complex component 4 [Amyelois transitella]XP_060805784.1 gamma-tubulin complex component 4 [Amyelois transitella]
MIHDALLVLWDCSHDTEETKNVNFENYVEKGDSVIYQRICDVAKSHHKIQNFVAETGFHARKTHSVTIHKNSGLYLQALSEGITEVLQSYKKTLLEVESLVIGNHNYTLSFVYSYVEKYRGLFDTLNKIISTIKERRLAGCQILSLTHQYILNGNEMVHGAVVKIFTNINKVFINQLCTWLLYGELRDPYQEFFICRNHEGDSDTFLSSPSTNTCDKSLVSTLQDTTLDCGYMLNANMIPYFVPLSLAQEILFIGKTVILFGFDPRKVKRHSFLNNRTMLPLQKCGADTRRFTIWEEKEAEFHEKLQKLKDLEGFEFCNFRGVIRDIKECVTKHLWTVAVEEAQLLQELKLMKDFYLLGRGELFLELLRLTAHILDKPTNRTSTRDMNHAFQLAARAVLLSNSADIEKFSFELPYVKPNLSNNSSFEDDSSTVADGWSTIILKYEFKWPLHLLFTPEVLARYNDMFRLLLRIKQTQHDLHMLWKTYKLSSSFSMCQLHNKLMFLMDNLQHYLQADVLETNFARLMEAVQKTNDFEKLKKAHANFLADVLSQSFLTVTPSSDSDCSGDATDYINNPVFCNIMELLKLCHSFCSITDFEADRDAEEYHLRGYSDRFNKLVKQLMQLLVSLRDRPCGVFLARLLMRLDYNRWLSGEAMLTQSVTNMLRC